MADQPFKSTNFDGATPPPSSNSFTISPNYPTDIWSKPGPPEVTTFDAPIIYKAIPLSKFQRARVTATADWGTLYDQGGLVFVLPSSVEGQAGKWIKTGVEFYNGEVFVSTVVKDRWADWSLVQAGVKGGNEVTLEMVRENDTMWIYAIDGEKKIPLREVTWVLSEKEQEVWVGVYSATPTTERNGRGKLVVEFKDWELELN
ncbi:hypothetical protein V495_07629 [Pseudogymnoascus sp. VKM F-4514 (FW-929)]|nr:hypothetical protein V495_07629 [Pseudogymnoascus sp. VKM F-4514 (FW-929)]KFY65995.1 hypothetical protein V497_01184 [Pseudogymnoascus sp. VKM F-4516 (FW-969)]